LNRDAFLKKLDNIRDLPTLSQVALEINGLLNNPGVSIKLVSDTINKDQAIVPKLLKIVNSSFFGFEKKISSISRAIVILGFNTVRNALVTVSVIDSLKDIQYNQVDLVEFWRHAISCAVISGYIAAGIRIESPEDAFTAGLIHDIGRLVLSKYFPKEFLDIIQSMKSGRTFYEAESDVIPIRHNQIGAYLTKRWHLPRVISTAVEFTHGVHDYNDRPVAYIVAVVEKMLYLQALGNPCPDQMDLPESEIREGVQELIKNRNEWFPDIAKEIESACTVLLGRNVNE